MAAVFLENLFLVGRNGMYRYNNSDYSMLTAVTADENNINGRKDKKFPGYQYRRNLPRRKAG